MVRTISKMLGPVQRQLRLLVGRAVIGLVNDGLKVQGLQVQLLADEVRDDVERFQEYGYTSNPHPGAEAIVVAVGGSRNHGIVIACEDRRYRLTGLASGEVALYTDEGDKIHLKRGRVVNIVTETLQVDAGTAVVFNSPTVTMNASTEVAMNTPLTKASTKITAGGDIAGAGQVSDVTGSMSSMRNTYNAHTHPGDSGGTTGTPSGSM